MPKVIKTEEFKKKASLLHNNKYDYSKVTYVRNTEKVCIICPTHGEFWQTPGSHKSKHGCGVCGGAKSITKGEFTDNNNGTYTIPISKGFSVLIDKEDFDVIKNHSWQVKVSSNNTYAKTTFVKNNKKFNIKMHRLLLKLTDSSIHVDHINGNGLDNRKCNLRMCTLEQNSYNTVSRGGTSKYKGVFKNNETSYQAYITFKKVRTHLGVFKTEEEAGLAYNKKAEELFGEFAKLNNI